jgi:hypothetical protein
VLVGEVLAGSRGRIASGEGGDELWQETMIVLVINRGIGFSFFHRAGLSARYKIGIKA